MDLTTAPPTSVVIPPPERFTVTTVGCVLALVLHRPAGAGPCACVVACHGLGASKDSDKYLLLADQLPRAGIALARFDFRGCGESSGVEADTTVETRVEDAGAVLVYLARHPGLSGRFGLLGSSLGGLVALHVAASRADEPPVVTWNAPADLATLSRPASLGRRFCAEVAAGRWASSPGGVRRHLVIQAARDAVVPAAHAVALHARAAAPKRLVVVPDADHRLSDPEARRHAVAVSLAWFLAYL